MNAPSAIRTRDRDTALRERAARVVPGGMWGHQRAAALPDGHPQFFAGGDGCRVRDVDGNEYIDFMCSWGPIILGHRHPKVEAAAQAQLAAGDCLDGPTEHAVALAELLARTIPQADWAMFQKNGTDATTACVSIARAGSGRRKILVARGAYHGAVPWCSPSLAGVTAEDRAHILHYEFNDLASLERAVAQGAERPGRHPRLRPAPRSRPASGGPDPRLRAGGARALRRGRRGPDPRRRARRVPPPSRRQLGGARGPPRSQRLEQGDRQRLAARGDHRRGSPPRRRCAGLRHRVVLVRRRRDGRSTRHHR